MKVYILSVVSTQMINNFTNKFIWVTRDSLLYLLQPFETQTERNMDDDSHVSLVE